MSSIGSAASDRSVPLAAVWLGGLGAIPFVGLALAIGLINGLARPPLEFALLGYGAVILSFLGGIRWGLAMVPGAEADDGLWRRLGMSVVPALIAWAALMVPGAIGCAAQAATFLAMLAIDIVASRNGEAPAWYGRLRWPLTGAAVAALLLGALA